MITLNLKQGSDAWAAVRRNHFTASEASIMMGCSSKASRNDLLRMKATGSEKEFSRWVEEVLFERGHQVEAAARPIADRIVSDDFYPVVATDDDGYLLASFDGVTLIEDEIWECKQWNQSKAEDVRNGVCPEEDIWQVVQQLIVSGAEKCLYMVTDGTADGTIHMWVTLDPQQEKALRAGWEQFAADLDAYEPTEAKPDPVGRAPAALPALRIEVTGAVTASNLSEFREHALAVFGNINTDLQTDDDFANAESTVKWCKGVEDKLDAAKAHALSQAATIDDLFRTIDSIREDARQKRLELDKLVKARKQSIREEILREARDALNNHLSNLQSSFESTHVIRMPSTSADFGGVMKGKRTIKSLRDAVDGELASAKIEASQVADSLRSNMRLFTALAAGHDALFRDLPTLILKDADGFEAIVKSRIAKHEVAEAKRLEAERERIRQEEQRKLEVEQQRKEQAAAADRQCATKPKVDTDPQPVPAGRPNDARLHTRAPRYILMALSDWQQEHAIDDVAMSNLFDVLNHYGAFEDSA